MATLSYFEQITARLDEHDLIKGLKKRRNEMFKGIRAIALKLTKLEDECDEISNKLHQQVKSLNLPIEIFDEVNVCQQQLKFLSSLAQEDDYLSELYLEYENELIALEEELFNLKNKPLSVAT